MELQFQMSIEPATKCTHVSASIDATYPSSNFELSTETCKVFGYKVPCKMGLKCKRYKNKKQNGTLSDLDIQKWGNHKETCQYDILTTLLFILKLL